MVVLNYIREHVLFCILIAALVSAIADYIKMKAGKGGIKTFLVYFLCSVVLIVVLSLIPVNLSRGNNAGSSTSNERVIKSVEEEKEEKEKAFYDGYADIIDEINSGFADIDVEFTLEQLTEFGMFINGDIATLSEDTYDLFWNAMVNNKQEIDAVNRVRDFYVDGPILWEPVETETKQYTLSFEPLAKLLISNEDQRFVRHIAKEHDRIQRLIFSDESDRDKIDVIDAYAVKLYRMLYKNEVFEDGDSGKYVGFGRCSNARVDAFVYCFMNQHIQNYIIQPDGANRIRDTKLQLYEGSAELGDISIGELNEALVDKGNEMIGELYFPSHHISNY